MKQIRNVKLTVSLAITMILMFALFSGAAAQGNTADQLTDAGWSCAVFPPHGWTHCFSPGGGQTLRVKVFNASGDTFLGTELLIHANVYAGQPCATDGGDPYTDLLPIFGIPYFACHFFDTSS